jgi:hypothetical protein
MAMIDMNMKVTCTLAQESVISLIHDLWHHRILGNDSIRTLHGDFPFLSAESIGCVHDYSMHPYMYQEYMLGYGLG